MVNGVNNLSSLYCLPKFSCQCISALPPLSTFGRGATQQGLCAASSVGSRVGGGGWGVKMDSSQGNELWAWWSLSVQWWDSPDDWSKAGSKCTNVAFLSLCNLTSLLLFLLVARLQNISWCCKWQRYSPKRRKAEANSDNNVLKEALILIKKASGLRDRLSLFEIDLQTEQEKEALMENEQSFGGAGDNSQTIPFNKVRSREVWLSAAFGEGGSQTWSLSSAGLITRTTEEHL